jgi:hypothetical protein
VLAAVARESQDTSGRLFGTVGGLRRLVEGDGSDACNLQRGNGDGRKRRGEGGGGEVRR